MLATFCIALNLPISFHGLFLFLLKLEYNQGFLDRIMRLINSSAIVSSLSFFPGSNTLQYTLYKSKLRIKSNVPRKAFFRQFSTAHGITSGRTAQVRIPNQNQQNKPKPNLVQPSQNNRLAAYGQRKCAKNLPFQHIFQGWLALPVHQGFDRLSCSSIARAKNTFPRIFDLIQIFLPILTLCDYTKFNSSTIM